MRRSPRTKERLLKPVTLGRLSIRKVLEMESGPPMPPIISGVTPADLDRLTTWYEDETIGPSAEQPA